MRTVLFILLVVGSTLRANDETALLAAIRAHPDEDVPRLVYADWLDEHGNTSQRARAEFIRLQIALATTHPNSREYQTKNERAEALLKDFHKDWTPPPLSEGRYSVENRKHSTFPNVDIVIWRRGFIERASFWQETAKADASRLEALETLPALTWIDVANNVTSTGLSRLAESPLARQLRGITFETGRSISLHDWNTLSKSLIQLESLHLGNESPPADLVRSIVDSHGQKLRAASFSARLPQNTLAPLWRSPKMTQLETLGFDHLSEQPLPALAPTEMPALKNIELRGAQQWLEQLMAHHRFRTLSQIRYVYPVVPPRAGVLQQMATVGDNLVNIEVSDGWEHKEQDLPPELTALLEKNRKRLACNNIVSAFQ